MREIIHWRSHGISTYEPPDMLMVVLLGVVVLVFAIVVWRLINYPLKKKNKINHKK